MILYFISFLLILLSFNYILEGNIYQFGILNLRVCIDQYSSVFLLLLLIISCSVMIWSYYYIDNEISYNRFILLLLFFIRSMIMLIIFSDLFFSLIGWDGLGVSSFLLIVFYKRRKRLGSGFLTAISNRIGDALLFCLLGLFLYGGALSTVLLLSLAITKSAQIPFTSWLPAAIAAPTPVRALVHSSTLVTAGVYLLIRYNMTDISSLLFLGGLTIVSSGMSACYERDLKKVVALSTLSQLGVMIVGIGSDEKAFTFFHLLSHACFKALLFMTIGVIIHTLYGTQDSRCLVQLVSTLPVAILSAVSCASLLGFYFTTGFYRKDALLENLYIISRPSFVILLFLTGMGLTVSYSLKIISGVFLNVRTAQVSTISLGGYGCWVKWPIYILGGWSIVGGPLLSRFVSSCSLVLPLFDKILPFLCLILGVMIGQLIHRVRPFFRRMLLLTPLSQRCGHISLFITHQKYVDKGWIEWVYDLSVKYTLLLHYSAMIPLGLGILALMVTLP